MFSQIMDEKEQKGNKHAPLPPVGLCQHLLDLPLPMPMYSRGVWGGHLSSLGHKGMYSRDVRGGVFSRGVGRGREGPHRGAGEGENPRAGQKST